MPRSTCLEVWPADAVILFHYDWMLRSLRGFANSSAAVNFNTNPEDSPPGSVAFYDNWVSLDTNHCDDLITVHAK
ncbi:MAG TPA: hypothetical protein VF290_26500 [Pyrinomonadaceae bacterium]